MKKRWILYRAGIQFVALFLRLRINRRARTQHTRGTT